MVKVIRISRIEGLYGSAVVIGKGGGGFGLISSYVIEDGCALEHGAC